MAPILFSIPIGPYISITFTQFMEHFNGKDDYMRSFGLHITPLVSLRGIRVKTRDPHFTGGEISLLIGWLLWGIEFSVHSKMNINTQEVKQNG